MVVPAALEVAVEWVVPVVAAASADPEEVPAAPVWADGSEEWAAPVWAAICLLPDRPDADGDTDPTAAEAWAAAAARRR